MTAQRSLTWQAAVKVALHRGLGVEDIAVLFTTLDVPTTADDVRREVEILRASGELTEIYRRQG